MNANGACVKMPLLTFARSSATVPGWGEASLRSPWGILPCIALAVTAVLCPSARAVAENKEAARVAYSEGTRYYDLNRFPLALEAFQRAYWNFEDPAFLFNIAQCHRAMKHTRDALAFYRTYLRKLPDAPNAGEVRRLIADLEAASALEEQSIAAAHASPPPVTALGSANGAAPAATLKGTVAPPSPRRRELYRSWWIWTAVGVVAAGAAVGIALGVTEANRSEQTLTMVRFP
jgi:tetratricopeptide (TPR) repeat protein